MLQGGKGPDPRALAAGRINPYREGKVFEVILDGRSDGTAKGIFHYLAAHPPIDYEGKIRWPTVDFFVRRAAEAGIIEAVQVGGHLVYLPLEDGPPFGRGTPAGLAFRQKVLSGKWTPGQVATRTPAPGSAVYLLYWKPDQFAAAVAQGRLDYAGSAQIHRLKSGDRIWIVSTNSDRQLVTLGAISVQRIVSRSEAAQFLAEDLWPAEYYALPADGDHTPVREVPLSSIVSQLRFESASAPMLDLTQGAAPLGQQLQALRRLTPRSANSVARLFRENADTDEATYQAAASARDKIDSADRDVRARVRAEQGALRRLLFGGAERAECAICGQTYPVALLIAAHVKRRADCTKEERDDWENNVVPMCCFGCDNLFEAGVIVVAEGKVAARKPAVSTDALERYLGSIDGRVCRRWSEKSRKYFEWHAENRGKSDGGGQAGGGPAGNDDIAHIWRAG